MQMKRRLGINIVIVRKSTSDHGLFSVEGSCLFRCLHKADHAEVAARPICGFTLGNAAA